MLSTILRRVDGQRCSIQRLWCLRFSGQGLIDVARRRDKNDPVAIAGPTLGAHASEEICHAVILLVRPLLHRMVVTLRAIDGHAQKRLRNGLSDTGRVFMKHVKIRRAIVQRTASGSHYSARESV